MKYSRLTYFVTFYVALATANVTGQGTTNEVTFYSPSLDENRGILVYLPAEYSDSVGTNYPVIYFLHGANSNHLSYEAIITELNGLILLGEIRPTIVVLPDASNLPFVGSFYTNSVATGNFEDYVYKDVVSYIDSTFRTLSDKNYRSIMGHSMGGYGAMKIAIKHPELFNAVASLNGTLDYESGVPGAVSALLAEAGEGPPYVFDYGNGFNTKASYSAAAAFSPNLNKPPTYSDFILDEQGEVIDSVLQRWIQHSPANLVRAITYEDELKIYFDAGTNDELVGPPFNEGFRDTLDKYQIVYEFSEYDGGHTTNLLTRVGQAAEFLNDAITVTNNEFIEELKGFNLSQNYPNPFNPSTNISFELPQSGLVQLKIYNLLGQEVASLVDKRMNSGNHSVSFNASQLSSGVYIYRLIAGNQSITKKMMLIK